MNRTTGDSYADAVMQRYEGQPVPSIRRLVAEAFNAGYVQALIERPNRRRWLEADRAAMSQGGGPPEKHGANHMSKHLTTDPNDPRLGRGSDSTSQPQNKVYLVLSEEERAKGFVRPVRRSYVHTACGAVTTMGLALAETYARDPKFYGATYCCSCSMHKPVSEFKWDDTDEVVGS